MKRKHLSLLIVFGLLLCINPPVYSQEPLILVDDSNQLEDLSSSDSQNPKKQLSESESIDILYSEDVFLTATRSAQHIREVTDNVVVITREEIDRWPAADLDEALGFVNGVVIQDDGHLGQVATAQIYGSKSREVRVMVDGITFNATSTGGIADLSQIPLDFVEKIEIIKGASSSVWGSAMGGVINIITRPAEKRKIPKLNGTFSWGEYGTQRNRGEAAASLGPVNIYASGSYEQSRGFRAHGDSLQKRAFLKLDIPFSEMVRLQGSFGYSGSKISEFEFPNTGGGTKADRHVLSRYGSAGFVITPSDGWTFDAFYKISERSFGRDSQALPGGTAARFFGTNTVVRYTKARSLIHKVSLRNVWEINDFNTWVVGSDIGVDVYSDAVFSIPFPAGPLNTTLNVNKKNTRHAYFTNYQLSWWWFDWTFGTRIDATNSYGTEFSPSAGMVARLPFFESLFRANVSRAFNAPSLVDRFQTAGTLLANPDLKAERAIVYNLGLESNPKDWLKLNSVFFQTFVKDSIQTITRSDGLRQRVNFDSERRTGFESNVEVGPFFGFSSSYGATYVKAVNPGKGPVQSRPRFTQDVKVNYSQKFLGMKLNAHIAGRYMDLVQYAGFGSPVDQAFIFDGKVLFDFPVVKNTKISLFLEGENLFNEDFSFDGLNDPNPQRNFEAGFKFSIA